MQYEFLKQFPKRMKHVGRYALLFVNSSQKSIWKQYGFLKIDEQANLIFAILLYVMEQSLKDGHCTVDDIGAYVDSLNMRYLGKPMGYEDCKALGDYILNVILSNEGKAMYFDGFDFENGAYKAMHVSYVANRIVYVDSEVRRTSYYLTEDGYNLILSTMEIEENMRFSIHEIIFRMHLEKQSYDKAVDDIKNVFNLLRIQLQKIKEAMGKIRRNALSYSVAEYEAVLEGDLAAISDTKQKFLNYRDLVKKRAAELEEIDINVGRLSAKEEGKLKNLSVIEQYLTRAIDEYQKILSSHFDLKSLYTHELELLSQMSFIRRFSIRNELFEKILDGPQALGMLDGFLRPLFLEEPQKIYNLKKSMELQKPLRRKMEKEEDGLLEFGSEEWMKQEERRQQEKMAKYEMSLSFLLQKALETECGEVTLAQIGDMLSNKQEDASALIPDVQVFKEIMVELLKNGEMDLRRLKKEQREYISEGAGGFVLNEMLLSLDETMGLGMREVSVYRVEDGRVVAFEYEEEGVEKRICCSNVMIRIRRED
ncbi:MAG: hypothetical protein HFI06_07235 [Eubacterium sp.]|jgi:hypothetical protein|nr:hypothetical protein [Eubacterium sp.]